MQSNNLLWVLKETMSFTPIVCYRSEETLVSSGSLYQILDRSLRHIQDENCHIHCTYLHYKYHQRRATVAFGFWTLSSSFTLCMMVKVKRKKKPHECHSSGSLYTSKFRVSAASHSTGNRYILSM